MKAALATLNPEGVHNEWRLTQRTVAGNTVISLHYCRRGTMLIFRILPSLMWRPRQRAALLP